MSSSDQAKTQPVVRPSEEPPQASAAAGLEDALQRIAGQIGDADERHCDALADMQERLGQLGRQVEQIRAGLPEQHAGAFTRLEHEIAGLAERVATFGRERQAQKGTSGKLRPEAPAAADEPWDAQSAEALTRVYEMAQAEMSASRRQRRAPASGKQPGPTRAMSAQPQAPVPAYDQAWLEARFAGIAALLQQSLADSNPAKSLAALDRRFDRLEGRLDTLVNDVSMRFGGAWLELIEEHIEGLAGHFEATSRQLARLDAVDEQLRQLARTHEEQLQWSRAQPASLRDDAVAAMIDTAAERAASRLAATLPAAATPAPEAEGSERIDALEALLQDYIAERRRGEEATSGMLNTIEEALIRILDRVDAMEAARAAPYVPADGDAPGQDGMDAESDRLAEAYAAGARILGQKPSKPTLDAADYAPPVARQEESLEPAGGPHDATAAEATQTRQELSASAMRAKLKAQAAPEEPTPASPVADEAKPGADKREYTKTSARAGRSWSNLLLGGAMILLFGCGYLVVDLFVARGVMPALQQNSIAPAAEVQPAADPAEPKTQHGRADPQPEPQTVKPEVAPATKENEAEPVPGARAAAGQAARARDQDRRSGPGGATPASGSRIDAGAARHGPAGQSAGGKRRRSARRHAPARRWHGSAEKRRRQG